ncbi:hypothetical protein CEXT_228601 [Caerostris extrusa]|uniref:Uncharacterized protein n=1 Tax=Caerostris extrusa TaxID=172846 RepID=A0AAV4NCJ5_CAEEX|nr:hypothetical protein CEXT_228601 [Caerostris extrusa]
MEDLMRESDGGIDVSKLKREFKRVGLKLEVILEIINGGTFMTNNRVAVFFPPKHYSIGPPPPAGNQFFRSLNQTGQTIISCHWHVEHQQDQGLTYINNLMYVNPSHSIKSFVFSIDQSVTRFCHYVTSCYTLLPLQEFAIMLQALAILLQAFNIRLQEFAIMLQALAILLQAFTIRLQEFAIMLQALAILLQAFTIRLQEFAIMLQALAILLQAFTIRLQEFVIML